MLGSSLRLASALLLVGAWAGAPPAGAAEKGSPEKPAGPPTTWQTVAQGTALAPPGVEAAAFGGDGPPNCILERSSLKAPPGTKFAEAGDGPPGAAAVEPQRAKRHRRAPLVRGSGPWVHCD